jgi:hypothetical protein
MVWERRHRRTLNKFSVAAVMALAMLLIEKCKHRQLVVAS